MTRTTLHQQRATASGGARDLRRIIQEEEVKDVVRKRLKAICSRIEDAEDDDELEALEEVLKGLESSIGKESEDSVNLNALREELKIAEAQVDMVDKYKEDRAEQVRRIG